MTRAVTRIAAVTLLSAVCLPVPAWPQCLMGMAMGLPYNNNVNGTGTATLTRPPTALRMYVELLAEGNTRKEALEKLKERREAAVEKLKEFDAREDSIACGLPWFTNTQLPRALQTYPCPPSGPPAATYSPPTSTLVPLGSAPTLPPGSTAVPGTTIPGMPVRVAEGFSVSAALTAEWSIEADTPEESLLLAQALERKLNVADISGVKELARRSLPKTLELAKGGFGYVPTPSGTAQPAVPSIAIPVNSRQAFVGQPLFLYVAEVSDEDSEKAKNEAFAKAKSRASQLTSAAGGKLGTLIGVNGLEQRDDMSHFASPSVDYGWVNYVRSLKQRLGEAARDNNPNQATASSFGPIKFNFSVIATYKLGK